MIEWMIIILIATALVIALPILHEWLLKMWRS